MTIVAPSILSANFARLYDDIKLVENAGANWLHIDIMDGHFVPNITIGPQVVADIKQETSLFLDIHLMIEKPEHFINAFYEAGANLLTVHLETCQHLHRVIYMIKDLGIKAGVALNPATPVSLLEDVINDIDLVLIMSVNPGFAGQTFISRAVKKIKAVKNLTVDNNLLVEVDGGVNLKTGSEVVRAGCDVLVAGSYIFNSSDVNKAVNDLKKLG